MSDAAYLAMYGRERPRRTARAPADVVSPDNVVPDALDEPALLAIEDAQLDQSAFKAGPAANAIDRDFSTELTCSKCAKKRWVPNALATVIAGESAAFVCRRIRQRCVRA